MLGSAPQMLAVRTLTVMVKTCLLRDTDELAQPLRRQPGWGGRAGHATREGAKGSGRQHRHQEGRGSSKASLASKLSSVHSRVTSGKLRHLSGTQCLHL